MKLIYPFFSYILMIFSFHFSAFANQLQQIQPHPIFEKFPDISPQPYNEEYFEWIDLLESIDNTKTSFNMLEIGAGYGRWSARGAVAAKSKKLPFSLTLIEAIPNRCYVEIHEEMEKHGIQKDEYRVIPAAVGNIQSSMFFYISSTDGKQDLKNWFGQCVMLPHDSIIGWAEENYYGLPVGLTAYGYKAVEVDQLALSTILNEVQSPIIDLCDFDIQGNEFIAIAESIYILNERVKRLHIGTHSHEIERNLKTLLSIHGWKLLRDFPCLQMNDTPYGKIEFVDGVQSWINPRIN